ISRRSSRYTCFTRYPWMSIPRICPATVRASFNDSAGLMPPALPRPPTSTCALTMHGSGGSRISAGEGATTPRGTGVRYGGEISFALYSRNFTRDRSRRWVEGLYLLRYRVRRLDWRTRRCHEVAERLHDPLRRRSGFAISDCPTVQFDDRPDLRRGPADERLVRGPDIVQREEPFLRLQAELRDELEHRLSRDAGLRDDDQLRSTLAFSRIESEIPFAPRDDRPDVPLMDVVPAACLEDDVRHLVFRVRDLQVDGLGGVVQPFEVAVQFEDSAVVRAGSFEYAVAVEEAMIEDADLRLGLRVELAVDVDTQLHAGDPERGMEHRFTYKS